MLKFVLHHRVVMVNIMAYNPFVALCESMSVEWHELTRNATHLVVMMKDDDATRMQAYNSEHKIMATSSDGELPPGPLKG